MQPIDIRVIQKNIEELDKIGKTGSGGTTRLSYSTAWRQGQVFITDLMQAAGMTVERDAVGNLIGIYSGQDPTLPYLMVGSHLDTVPEGGSLDGALGILAAIECVRNWYANGYRPLRTVKVIATVEEEGTLFGVGCLGSRVLVGAMTPVKLASLQTGTGRSLAQHLAENGMDIESAGEAGITPQDIYGFLELHVEQGSELDLAGTPWAIVTDIVGIDRIWVTIQGQANHAGTTRMDRRKDALVAASSLIQKIYQGAFASQGLYVATVGMCNVTPGATNVIPGKVELTVETRAAQDSVMEKVHQDIAGFLPELTTNYGVKVTITKRSFTPAVHLKPIMIAELESAAGNLNMTVNKMPSWAGHDAKIMASITACGMLFVPSIQGVSHSCEEATRWLDVEQGIKVFQEAMRIISSRR